VHAQRARRVCRALAHRARAALGRAEHRRQQRLAWLAQPDSVPPPTAPFSCPRQQLWLGLLHRHAPGGARGSALAAAVEDAVRAVRAGGAGSAGSTGSAGPLVPEAQLLLGDAVAAWPLWQALSSSQQPSHAHARIGSSVYTSTNKSGTGSNDDGVAELSARDALARDVALSVAAAAAAPLADLFGGSAPAATGTVAAVPGAGADRGPGAPVRDAWARGASPELRCYWRQEEAFLTRVLAPMEARGVTFDPRAFTRARGAVTAALAALERRALAIAGAPAPLLTSPEQVSQVMYDRLGLPRLRAPAASAAAARAAAKRRGGGVGCGVGGAAYHTTGQAVVAQLARAGHEFPQLLLRFRALHKHLRGSADLMFMRATVTAATVTAVCGGSNGACSASAATTGTAAAGTAAALEMLS